MNLQKIIKYGFHILIKGARNEEKKIRDDYINRLKNVGEIFGNYKNYQMKTNPKTNGGTIPSWAPDPKKIPEEPKKKKKKKAAIKSFREPYKNLADELIYIIAFFIPYGEDLYNFIKVDDDLYEILWKNDLFWELKFKSEYKGYIYPIYFLPKIDPKDGWRKATAKFLDKLKNYRSNWEKEYDYEDDEYYSVDIKSVVQDHYFEYGNELILRYVLYWNPRKFKHALYLAKRYFKRNKKLNTELLHFILTSLWMNDDGTKGINIFYELIKYKNRDYDKRRIFLTFLKEKKNYGDDIEFRKFIDKLSNHEDFKEYFLEKKFLLEAIEINGVMFKYLVFNIDKGYNKNINVILKALKTNTAAFKYIDLSLQDDIPFIYRAIKLNRKVFRYVPTNVKDDKNFFLKFMNNLEDIDDFFPYAGDSIKDDKNIILYSFLKTDFPIHLKYASEGIRNNVEIFKRIIKHDEENIWQLQYAGKNVRDNLDFMRSVVNIDKRHIERATPRVKYLIFKELVTLDEILKNENFIETIEKIIKKKK